MADTETGSQPFMKGSMIWKKYGPLPVWAWAGLVLGAAVIYSVWRKNKSNGDPAATEDALTAPYGNQTAPYVFLSENAPINITVPSAPPGGGRTDPPGTPPVNNPPAKPDYVWKVQSGQTLSGIASYLNTTRNWGGTWQQIYDTNKGAIGSNPNLIKPGLILKIPHPPAW